MLNDLNLPVWGGDFDTQFIEWGAQGEPRRESVTYEFPAAVTVDSFEIYWVENLEPQKPLLNSKFYGEKEGLRHPYGEYLKADQIRLEYFDAQKNEWAALPFEAVPPADQGRQHHLIKGTMGKTSLTKLKLSFDIPANRPAGMYEFSVQECSQ